MHQGNDVQSRMRTGAGRFGGRLAILLIGGGLLAMWRGWDLLSGTTVLQQQMSYAVSGGLMGFALVVIGSALMVLQGYREERAKLEAKLDELIAATARGGSGGVRGPAGAPADLAGLVVAGSASYHVPGCRLVDGREEVEYLTPDEAQRRFLQPCRVCAPQPSNVEVL